MKPGNIRPIAVCVIRRENSIFVFEGEDKEKGETFYRPLGGTIEFGECSIDTVRRELHEEIGEEIRNIHYLGMLENVFRYEGEIGHEIVIIFEADFASKAIYEKDQVIGYEDNGKPFKAVWKPIEYFANSNAPLYPDGLLRLLTDP